ncbi:MAG: tetratricopeptide repeat protein, partial [Planctomycetales bacterium]|nr:tetratricopeptide repeat protein [Planctomycetales bacterium]
MQCHQAGRFSRAIELYDAHLQAYPHDAAATHLLGVACHQSGNPQRAVDLLRRAVALDGTKWKYVANLGAAHRASGRLDLAIEAFERAVALSPHSPEPLNNLGAAQLELGQTDRARRSLETALSLAPGHVEAHINLAQLCHDEGKLEEAVASYTRALRFGPNHLAAYQGRGDAQLARVKPDAAIEDFAQVIARDPRSLDARAGMWRAQLLMRRFDDALQTADDALAIDGGSAAAHCQRAEVLLGKGDWRRGGQEYEWRFRRRGGPARRHFGVPEWQGEPLAGKRLLIYSEQTLVEEVMFARAIAAVARQTAGCVIECDSSLVSLFERSFGEATVHRRDVRETSWVRDAGPIDYQAAAGSLMARLRADDAIGHEPTAFLRPNPQRVEKWQARLASLDGGWNVGIAWQRRNGKPAAPGTLTAWRELLATAGVNWVNLQNGEVDDALADVTRQ